MAENPLLPQAELRALHKLLHQAADPGLLEQKIPAASRKRGRPDPVHPALLAGTLLQLRSGDVAVTTHGHRVVAALLSRADSGVALSSFPEGSSGTLLATGLAAGVRRGAGKGAVLSFVQAGATEPDWQDALGWAQEERLPLLLAVADPSGPEVFRKTKVGSAETFTWTSVQKQTARLQLPILTVDGEDPVAIYRVMQESLLRARSGGGPAILWAALPVPSPKRSLKPHAALQRMEQYLSSRSIHFR